MSAENPIQRAILRRQLAHLTPEKLRRYHQASAEAIHVAEFGHIRRGGQRLPEAMQLALKLMTADSIAFCGEGIGRDQIEAVTVSARDAEVAALLYQREIRNEADKAYAAAHETPDLERDGDSWRQMDLKDTIAGLQDGTITPPVPTIGLVCGGTPLFYLGMVNGIAGASGSGKSMVAKGACCQEIARGEHVIYIDLAERFHYVSPRSGFTDVALRNITELIQDYQPTLVIFDSTGEGLAIDGVKPNDDDDVARWFRKVPAAIADLGPAVLLIDHMTKADDGAQSPIGSQRKLAAIGGSQYILRPGRPFARGQAGRAYLVTAKDRHGHHAKGSRAAEFHVTPGEDGGLRVELRASAAPANGSGADHWRSTALMERASKALQAATEPLSLRSFIGEVKGKKGSAEQAIAALVAEGYVTVEDGPRGAKLHRSAKPYLQIEDPQSDSYKGNSSIGDSRPPKTTPICPRPSPVP